METVTEEQTYDLILTDIRGHFLKATNPTPWYRAIMKSFRSGKPGRAFTNAIETTPDGLRVIFDLPPKVIKEMEEAEQAGKRVRVLMTKAGLPFSPGKDFIDRFGSETIRIKEPLLTISRDGGRIELNIHNSKESAQYC